MDKILFLTHVFLSSLLYCLIKYFSLHQLKGLSTIQVSGYLNMTSFILICPLAFIYGKDLFKRFPKYLGLSFSVIASMVKIYGMGHVPIGNVYIISFTQPLFLILLSFFFLKEYDKKLNKKYSYLLLTLFGAFIFIGKNELQNNYFIYSLMIFHIIFKSLVGIFIKKRSQNDIATMFYLMLFYCLFGMITNFKIFDYKLLFEPCILFLTLISIGSLFTLVKSYQISNRISLLQNIMYLGTVFTMFFSYFLFDEKITSRHFIGGFFIFLSIALSNNIFRKFCNKSNVCEKNAI